MRLTGPAMTLLAGVLLAPVLHAADTDAVVRPVKFEAGSSTAVVKGQLAGRRTIDFRVPGRAGEALKVGMKASSRSAYFNVLPPGSKGEAMFREGAPDRAFAAMLPDDGTYTVRVYLVRAAARRGEASDFTLEIAREGKALAPLAARDDARVSGTRFHAVAKVRCEPPYTQVRECEAGVVRRGRDGTATVDLKWGVSGDESGRRRILFVAGEPRASDSPDSLSVSRNERGDRIVVLGGEERYEIPEALLTGG